MPEIEFIETGPPTATTPIPRDPRLRWRSLLRAVPALLASAAAALVLWALVLAMYRTKQAADAYYGLSLQSISPDGTLAGADGSSSVVTFQYDNPSRGFANQSDYSAGAHGVRYGIALAGCAGLLAVAALLLAMCCLARVAPWRRRLAAGARAAALLGAGGAAAMSATVYLDYRAALDQNRSIASDGAGEAVVTHFGTCWWVAALGAAIGLLAAAQPAQMFTPYRASTMNAGGNT